MFISTNDQLRRLANIIEAREDGQTEARLAPDESMKVEHIMGPVVEEIDPTTSPTASGQVPY